MQLNSPKCHAEIEPGVAPVFFCRRRLTSALLRTQRMRQTGSTLLKVSWNTALFVLPRVVSLPFLADLTTCTRSRCICSRRRCCQGERESVWRRDKPAGAASPGDGRNEKEVLPCFGACCGCEINHIFSDHFLNPTAHRCLTLHLNRDDIETRKLEQRNRTKEGWGLNKTKSPTPSAFTSPALQPSASSSFSAMKWSHKEEEALKKAVAHYGDIRKANLVFSPPCLVYAT